MKLMNKTFIKPLLLLVCVLLLLGGFYFIIASQTNTFTGRWMAWKSSDVDDYKLFPSRMIENKPPVFDFTDEQNPDRYGSISYQFKGNQKTADLDELLAETGTTAFIVIKDDSLLYEGYFNGSSRDSIVTSFSIAKSITSILVGMAIDEGYIGSLDDPLIKYIPELSQVDPRYQDITLEHLLSMKSGIKFKDTDIPWHDKSRAYYHPYLREVVVHLPIAGPPGEEFAYNTFNPILLGIVLERATGQSVTQYTETRLWQRLGMEFDASWSIDSLEDGLEKMESGLNARAIDFAKIGRLMLTRGVWHGEQILSDIWIESSMRVDPENNVSKFGDTIFYQNGWWIYGPSETEKYTVSAWGHLGQYLFIFPDQNMAVLRFGREIGRVDSWQQIAQEIVEITTFNHEDQ